MDNATKALLIAASVLITIVVIALGIAIIKSGSDTSKQASQVQNMISESTDSATNSTISSIKKNSKQTKEEFNHDYQQYVTKVNWRGWWGFTSENFLKMLEMNNNRGANEKKVMISGPGNIASYCGDTNYIYYFSQTYDEDGYLSKLISNGRELISH